MCSTEIEAGANMTCVLPPSRSTTAGAAPRSNSATMRADTSPYKSHPKP
jgi:hypothetical protein